MASKNSNLGWHLFFPYRTYRILNFYRHCLILTVQYSSEAFLTFQQHLLLPCPILST